MNKKNKTHIEQKVDQYIDGQLSGEEIEELWSVLIQHEEYMDYMNTSANLQQVVQAENKEPAKIQRAWVYAAAAVIALLLVVFAALRLSNFNTDTQLEPVASIELPYYRSTDAAADFTDREQIIRKAIRLFYANKFDEAVGLLKEARTKATDAGWIAKLDITLGILYYNEDRFEQAAFYFSDVVKYKDDIEVLKLEKAYWYLGNSYFQMLQLKKAEAAMRKAYALNGAYRRVAKSYLLAMADASS